MFKVEIHKIKNASVEERKAFRAGGMQLEIELNDPEFWVAVAMEYNSWENKPQIEQQLYLGGNGSVGGRDMTFKEFKARVLSGADKFNTEADGDLDILATFYYSFMNVVGYTKASTWWTWVNRNVVQGFNVAEIAGHQLHEYLHNLGLHHPKTNRKSVVYQCGYLVRDRIRERLNMPDTINIYYKRSLWTRVKRLFRSIF